MMPERDRLAETLFKLDGLRSPAGISVLRDMVALYQKRTNVEYRPGLERSKCSCGKQKESDTYDWNHIYRCYQETSNKTFGFRNCVLDAMSGLTKL
jgi:hypothetical protein